jgi:hypothetical protein
MIEFDELGGIDKMEALQDHPNERIYEIVLEVLGEHFGFEEERENFEGNVPMGGFNFA